MFYEATAAGDLVERDLFDTAAFDIPDSDPALEPKPLAQYFEPEQKGLDAYMTVPHRRERGLNLSIGRQGVDTRYLAHLAVVRDEHTGGPEKPIQIARKNFRRLVEGDSRQAMSALRVARVLRTAAGTLQLDPHFVPPLLGIAARLRLRVRKIAGNIRGEVARALHRFPGGSGLVILLPQT